MNDWVADYELGTVVPGTNDAGETTNIPQEGRTYVFSVDEKVATALGISDRATGRRITARLYRNATNGVLLPGETFTVLATGYSALNQAVGKSLDDARHSYIVDPMIPAAGVPDGDLFYGIVNGPSKVLPLDGGTTTAGGLFAAASSGRVKDGLAGSDANMGVYLETNGAGAADGTLVPVDVDLDWN